MHSKDLLEKHVWAHLVTLNDDGSPQVTPVWLDYDGQHIRRLAERYLETGDYPWPRPGEARDLYKNAPEGASCMR